MPHRQPLELGLERSPTGKAEPPIGWSRPFLLVVVLMLGSAAGGCGFGPVEVEPVPPVTGSEQACSDLDDALPEVVDDAVRRDVDPPSTSTAAWGDPPIILRCGVSEPSRELGVSLLVVDDVAWYPAAGEGGTFFTTVERETFVEVAVPDDYSPAGDVLVDLGPAIRSTIPEIPDTS